MSNNVIVLVGIVLFMVFFLLINLYFKLAVKFNIIDAPNLRSSHRELTIRGGAIIFPISILLYEILFHFPDLHFLIGLLLLSVVCFWDDMKDISTQVRFLSQIVAVVLLLMSLGVENIWFLVAIFPIIIGFINGYNFMDGINGITGLYSVVILVSLFLVNIEVVLFVKNEFFLFLFIPLIVFLFYNFRKKAKCFAGDIGSITIAFTLSFLFLLLIKQTEKFIYLLFVSVYGIDILATIIERLWLKQNIFKPHRMHLYQLFANEGKWSHLKVATIYSTIQLLINFIVISLVNFSSDVQLLAAILIVVPLLISYISLKQKYKSLVLS
ncbi:MraY family glycosyltransferase [Saccharicrinis aurantiacus]|uniref:hypothetical protein n=1 Tax=Saccharicrinis aurantiacus TaxID=1849719 RepID=UPI0009F92F8A|nr:hypothetical protein [Saccharicrinis aurantiacus]